MLSILGEPERLVTSVFQAKEAQPTCIVYTEMSPKYNVVYAWFIVQQRTFPILFLTPDFTTILHDWLYYC